ncbi:Response regulator receiver domain-containing protein [Desulfacinum infernum DSM 9756]|uniref:Response regulator receiver domain-containing protein n=1 Tax=Desulfacinum infernum DSM 9756 TaxID=1121391 RepID=A0A1M5F995_9BACT|nr:response regulator [Desulfacinum infernum]SHF88087.1 Response regulator receiver domain-containing protein [Desulfacinum infernum DSM 9756]
MEGLRVLLVDDEVEFVSTLAERLEIRGMEVLVASDGEEALRRVQEEPLDVVVLDVRMPGLGGLDVLKRIKEMKPDLPVILLTGHSATRDGIEGMRLGAFDYLMKPLDIETLMAKMKEACAGR